MSLGKIGLRFASTRRGVRARDGWARLARLGMLLPALALLPLGGVALAQEAVDVHLDAVGNSGVSGTAKLAAAGEATEVTLEVTGLDPDAEAQATMHAGTCDMPSASFAALPNFRADGSGRATATGSVLFHGSEDVALATMADGEHVIVIQASSQVMACGVIPRLTSAAAPSELPLTGGAGFPPGAALAGMLGLGALTAGLFLRARSRPPRGLSEQKVDERK